MLLRKKYSYLFCWTIVIVALTGLNFACSAGPSSDQAISRESAGFAQPSKVHAEPKAMVSLQGPEAMNAALSLQQVFRDVARESIRSVVQIDTTTTVTSRRYGRSFDQPGGTGSGVIYDSEGETYYVLTNAHVIQNTDNIRITLHAGTEYEAQLIGADSSFYDLAVLSFKSEEVLMVATIGDSDRLVVGDQVLAVGSPFGFQSTVTSGIISGLGREQSNNPLAEYIQTDASINPGNSGGALVGLDGSVIAINTWIASRTGGSVGLGFALPINTAVKIAEQLRGDGVRPGYLGIMIENASAISGKDSTIPTSGVMAWSVFKGSPANRAGLIAGDIVTAVDGVRIEDRRELLNAIAEAGAGTHLVLTVERDGVSRNLRIRLGERHGQQAGNNDWPGIAVAADPNSRGVVVRGVTRTSWAGRVGLRVSDLITKVNDIKVYNAESFYDEVAGAEDVELTIERGGTTTIVEIRR